MFNNIDQVDALTYIVFIHHYVNTAFVSQLSKIPCSLLVKVYNALVEKLGDSETYTDPIFDVKILKLNIKRNGKFEKATWDEAYDLIKTALSLSPDDPYIMDSMGWVEFRMGRFEKAEEILRRAFAIKADAEIAAHLGEVLWVRGREEEAKKLWRNAGGRDTKNDTLKSTLHRLQIKL